MINYDVRSCNYCQRPIRPDQRWVREKIYEPAHPCQVPAYRHFHAEPFGTQGVSCWESYWLERELARMGGPVGTVVTAQAANSASGPLPHRAA
jgi:hypothetical protein